MTREQLLSTFSKGITKFIERKGVTIRFLAKQAGCSEQNIYKMRDGSSLPSMEVLVALVENGMRLEEIFGSELAAILRNNSEPSNATPLEKAKIVRQGLRELLVMLDGMKEGV